MSKTIRLLAVCWITSPLAVGCLHRATSLNMLAERADYDGKAQSAAQDLKLTQGQSLTEISGGKPVRSAPKVAHIWIFPHETPTKEYFWGGWISVVIEGDQWQVDRPQGVLPNKPSAGGLL